MVLFGQKKDQSCFIKNASILSRYTSDLQKQIFMKMTKMVIPMATEKQMAAGMIDPLSDPSAAKMMALIAVINNPETAVPTLYLETTSAERQLIMAYIVTSSTFCPIPMTNEQNINKTNPSCVCYRKIVMASMPPKAAITIKLPTMIMLIYLNLLLISWKDSPTMMYPMKSGIGRKEQILQSRNFYWKKSSAARTAFHPKRELIPFMVKIAIVLLDYFYIFIICHPSHATKTHPDPSDIYHEKLINRKIYQLEFLTEIVYQSYALGMNIMSLTINEAQEATLRNISNQQPNNNTANAESQLSPAGNSGQVVAFLKTEKHEKKMTKCQKIFIFFFLFASLLLFLLACLINKAPNQKISPSHIHPFLDYVSQPKKQRGGKMTTPKGTASAINLSFINKQGLSLADALYNEQQRRQRQSFHSKRIQFIKDKQKQFPGINLIKFNMRVDNSLDQVQKKEEAEQYARLQKKHKLSQIKQELPMCIVVRSFNNNAESRIQYNLNSIFTQNYTNYMAVVINDASDDGSDTIFRKYFHFFQIPKQKYAYIQNHIRKTALQNTYSAVHKVCSDDSIVIVVDGDDQLLGENTLKVFNAYHQRLKGGWIYSNFYHYIQEKSLLLGYSKDYTPQIKKSVSFRELNPQWNSHLRSFPAKLFKAAPAQNFKDDEGEYFKVTQDVAMFLPLVELACGHIYWIDEVNYLYNGNTGLNDALLRRQEQQAINDLIRKKKKMDCLKEYKDRPLKI